MLQCKDLFFRYGCGEWLIENLNLSIDPGEVVGLMGKSGLGKTTLARIISGYLMPEKGEVLLDGALLKPCGFSPVQLIYQHPELAVNPRWKVDRILSEAGNTLPDGELLEKLAVSRSWFKRYPHELSGGELQRICVARVLNSKVKYLICDEISGMLDAITQAMIWSAVIEFSRINNAGVLLISHDRELIERLCSREIRL